MKTKLIAAGCAALLAIAACKPREDAGTGQASAATDAAGVFHPGAQIAWFEGTVPEALAAAKAQDKPLLLYWGAAWCPPCHLLKATVFADSRFIEKSRLFIPVYLDGDLPDAQSWGDKFRVTGYPTMVVLDPDQNETARIAGGLDLTQYALLLDHSLQDGRPVGAAMQALATGKLAGAELEAACRRVAWNSWGLSDELAAGSTDLIRDLRLAAETCGSVDAGLQTRLIAFAGGTAGNAAASGRTLDAALISLVETALARSEAFEQYDALRELAPDFFVATAAVDPSAAKRLASLYTAVMEKAALDSRFTRADQLGALYGALLVQKAAGLPADSPLAAAARERIASELASMPDDPYLRSGVATGVLEVMDALGELEDAYALASSETKRASYGYYFMSILADISEQLGRKEEALQWYESAYRESRGAATRVQWGASHAQAVLRLAPQDNARVRKAALAVIGELKGSSGLHRRSRTRIQNLDRALIAWAGQQQQRRAVLEELRRAYAEACPANCDPFLKG